MQSAATVSRPTSTAQLLRSGRLAGVEWRDLVALTPLETARELTLCLPWLALSLACAAGQSARMSGWRAIAFGPLFPLLLHRTALAEGNRRVRLWICAELAANVAWIASVFLWLRVDALCYHVIAMGVAQCLTAFFAVWTVHHDTEEACYPARTQHGGLRNFVSYHMFLHVEQHPFPQVPTCHLPALARRLDAVAPELTRTMVI